MRHEFFVEEILVSILGPKGRERLGLNVEREVLYSKSNKSEKGKLTFYWRIKKSSIRSGFFSRPYVIGRTTPNYKAN